MSFPTTQITVKQVDGVYLVAVPIIIEMPVEAFEVGTAREAELLALERFTQAPLEVHLAGVPLHVSAGIPLYDGEEADGKTEA